MLSDLSFLINQTINHLMFVRHDTNCDNHHFFPLSLFSLHFRIVNIINTECSLFTLLLNHMQYQIGLNRFLFLRFFSVFRLYLESQWTFGLLISFVRLLNQRRWYVFNRRKFTSHPSNNKNICFVNRFTQFYIY